MCNIWQHVEYDMSSEYTDTVIIIPLSTEKMGTMTKDYTHTFQSTVRICHVVVSHAYNIITPCARMRSRGIVFCCQFVCLKVCLSALFWAVCAFEERSRARLNPDR